MADKKTGWLWPGKGGNQNHSGYSPYIGKSNLSSPDWIVSAEVGAVFHGSPVIDSENNVYFPSTSGKVTSVNGSSGQVRWQVQIGPNPGNLALLDGYGYTCGNGGVAVKINLQTGEFVWKQHIGKDCPGDTWSATAVPGTVLLPCNIELTDGESTVCALSTDDGSTLWTYDMTSHGSKGYNQVYSVIGNQIILGDSAGGSYSLDLATGTENWYVPGEGSGMTTGGVVVGPNGKAYNGFNKVTFAFGVLHCLSISTGELLWKRDFVEGINAAPAVGPLGGYDGKFAVVVLEGLNVECAPIPRPSIPRNAKVHVLDADTGDLLWSYALPTYYSTCAGNTPQQTCCPDVWGQPTLAADGTVYASWSGGKSFALRDANHDGSIDVNSPDEYSEIAHGHGSNSNTAIVPGLTVVGTCNGMLGYL